MIPSKIVTAEAPTKATGKMGTHFDLLNGGVDQKHFRVLERRELLLTWLVLYRYANPKGITWVGTAKISELTGRSQRSVMRHLKKLRELGFLEQIQKPSPGTCAKWRVVLPTEQVTPVVAHDGIATGDTNRVTGSHDTEGGELVPPNDHSHDTEGGERMPPAWHPEQRNSIEQHQQAADDADFLTKKWSDGGCGIDPSAIDSIPKGFSSRDLELMRQKVNAELGIRSRPARMMGLLKRGPESEEMQALRKQEKTAAEKKQALPAAPSLPYGSSPLAYEPLEMKEARIKRAQEIGRQRSIAVQPTPTPEKNRASRSTSLEEKTIEENRRTSQWFADLSLEKRREAVAEFDPHGFCNWSEAGELRGQLLQELTVVRHRREFSGNAAEAAPERSEDAA
jgi:DNA-binding transcriptional ArsR family regulator